MQRRDFLMKSGAATLGLLGASKAPAEQAAQRPNILFILTDQQFADAMSWRIGQEHIHTPAMDRLAATGIAFTTAYAANPLCMPSRNAMFTGHFPHQTMVEHNTDDPALDKSDLPCMGKVFRDAGYETGYVGKWHLNFRESHKDAHGFEYMQLKSKHVHDDDCPRQARRFLEKKRTAPFFLVASFVNPHNICQWARGEELPDGAIGEAPAPEACPPPPENGAPPENETDSLALIRRGYHADRRFPVGDFDADKWRQYRWAYYRMIEKVDALIGQLLDDLDRLKLTENTLILFASDHGDCQGAHRFNQKTVFYEESTRVPCIISHKSVRQGAVSDALVSTGVDFLPTLCDFAGITPPKNLPGKSLKPIATGEEPADWRSYVVATNYMMQTGPVDGVIPKIRGRMVRSDRYKYCLYSHGKRRESLVDLKADPGEMHNLAESPDHHEIRKQLRGLLREHAEKHGDALALELLDPAYIGPEFERA